MTNLLADIPLYPGGGLKGPGNGPLDNPIGSGGAVTVFSKFISAVIGVTTIVAIIWAIFSIITGAISIISSGGDKQALESARRRITMGIIGLVVVLVALVIIEFVGSLLGLTGILNIQNLFNIIANL